MVARSEEREESSGLSGKSACKGNASHAALEIRDPFLERGYGGIHDPGVGVPILLEVEVRGGRLGVFEHVARRLKDRHRPSSGVGIRALTGVNTPRVEAEWPRHRVAGTVILVVRHSDLSPGRTDNRPAQGDIYHEGHEGHEDVLWADPSRTTERAGEKGVTALSTS